MVGRIAADFKSGPSGIKFRSVEIDTFDWMIHAGRFESLQTRWMDFKDHPERLSRNSGKITTV